MNLTIATPLEIDTKLAEIHNRRQTIQNRISRAISDAHKAIGDTQNRWAKGQPWTMNHRVALETCRAKAATAEAKKPWDSYHPAEVIAAYDAAVADLAALDTEDTELDAEYRRRPWPRFFLVTSSAGHIHKDMSCSTCRPSTTFGWLPELSGKDEAAAVASEGTILCSVCFPSAPVAWTLGRQPEGRCPGGGQRPAGEINRRGRSSWAKCSGCGSNQTVTQAGVIRQHKAK